jgi:hypothetical protein
MARKRLSSNHLTRCPVGSLLKLIALSAIFLFSATRSICLAAQTVVFNIECANALDRGLMVERDDFTEAKIETLAHDFLREHAQYKVISLLVGIDRQQVLGGHRGEVRIIDSSEKDPYSGVAMEVEKRMKLNMPTSPFARLIAIGGAGLLSITKDGAINERLIAGTSDPTNFEKAGVQYKLLHLTLAAGSEAVRGYCALNVFLQTRSQLSVSGLVYLTRRLQVSTAMSNVATNLRRDPWFLGDADFPLIPPFVRDLMFPDALQWTLSPALTCRFQDSKPMCSGQNFEP